MEQKQISLGSNTSSKKTLFRDLELILVIAQTSSMYPTVNGAGTIIASCSCEFQDAPSNAVFD